MRSTMRRRSAGPVIVAIVSNQRAVPSMTSPMAAASSTRKTGRSGTSMYTGEVWAAMLVR